jgi:hypothetical protein
MMHDQNDGDNPPVPSPFARDIAPGSGAYDVEFFTDGSIVVIQPVTEPAKTWWAENVMVEDWQQSEQGYACDHRCGHDILEAMNENGGLTIIQLMSPLTDSAEGMLAAWLETGCTPEQAVSRVRDKLGRLGYSERGLDQLPEMARNLAARRA